MVEESKTLNRAIESNYDKIKPIVKYLDNEDLHKGNYNVKAPR